MDRFWRVLERHGWPAQPVAAWRAEVGREAVAAMRRLGWLESRPLEEGGWWPCPSPGGIGCPRRVVEFGGRLVAVCGREVEDCADVVIGEEDAEVLEASPGAIRAGLARALELDVIEGGGTEAGRPMRLGERGFGEERAAFWYAPRVPGRGLGDWIDVVGVRERGRAVALVVPREAGVAMEDAAMLRRGQVSVLGLDRLLRIEEGAATIDLADFVVEHRFAGVDPGALLWPRYELVLDPEGGRYWFGGKRLDLDGKLKPAPMLEELARHPGQVVTRDQLCRVMWPDSYGAAGTLEIDWDRRVREHKWVLAGLLGAVHNSADAIVVARAGGDDADGGYALRLPTSRVAWWSGDAGSV